MILDVEVMSGEVKEGFWFAGQVDAVQAMPGGERSLNIAMLEVRRN